MNNIQSSHINPFRAIEGIVLRKQAVATIEPRTRTNICPKQPVGMKIPDAKCASEIALGAVECGIAIAAGYLLCQEGRWFTGPIGGALMATQGVLIIQNA